MKLYEEEDEKCVIPLKTNDELSEEIVKQIEKYIKGNIKIYINGKEIEGG